MYLCVVTRHRANVRRLRISSFPTTGLCGLAVLAELAELAGSQAGPGTTGRVCTQFEDEFGGAVQYSCVATVGTRRGEL